MAIYGETAKVNNEVIRQFRNDLAEGGHEHTPDEARQMLQCAEELFKLSYSRYMQYKALDEDDIRKMAQAVGDTYEHAKDVVEIILYVGELKYERSN